jgi:hypothetical protein
MSVLARRLAWCSFFALALVRLIFLAFVFVFNAIYRLRAFQYPPARRQPQDDVAEARARFAHEAQPVHELQIEDVSSVRR